jgi:uncharacterized protein (TIRG00374 family)
MSKNILISLSVGTVVSITALYLAFRNVPFHDLLSYLGSINYLWLVPTVATVLFGFALRAVRWRYILSSSHRVGFWTAYHPLMIGFMINCVLPGRVGEFARPLILNRKTQIPITTGLATVVVERVFDLAMLLMLFWAVSAGIHIDPGFGIDFGAYRLDRETLIRIFDGMLKLGTVLIIGIFFVSLDGTRRVITRLIRKLPELLFFSGEPLKERLNRKIATPLIRVVDNVAGGMSLVRQPRRIVVCFGLSILIWLAAALSYYLFSLGCPKIGLSPAEMTVVMIIICFAIALPSAPGYWGIWEAGGVFALMLFGVSEKEAAGFTLANHAVQIIPVILAGLLSGWVSGVRILQVYHQQQPPDPGGERTAG